MKFDEKVLTALEVLTDAAENDFELFRICTLVRDLISPPVVEQVDEKHQRFNGVTYYRTNRDQHYVAYDGIHCSIWKYYYGDIPAGYEVHHDNDNPADNDIANFKLLTKSEHVRLHRKKRFSPKRIKTFVCTQCGKEYRAPDNGHNRYCPDCRETAYILNCHPTTYDKICPVCGKNFTTVDRRQKYCSPNCSTKSFWIDGKMDKRTAHKTCPVCGKNFDTHEPRRVYCSAECRRIARNRQHNELYHRRRAAAKAAAAESPEKGTEGVNIVTEQGRD